MENNNELRPVLYIRDGKKVIEIEMYREQKYVVEFSYYQEDEEGWGSGTDEYLSREDLTNMAEGIRTIFRRERDSFEYSCSCDIFRLGLSYDPNEDRYTFTAALQETFEREYHITITKDNLTVEELEPYIFPFYVWEYWYPVGGYVEDDEEDDE